MKRSKIFLIPLLLIFGGIHINSDEINTYRWISADAGLRMRDASALTGEKICVIPYTEKVSMKEESGDEITLSGVTGKWCRVVWKNKEGWVFGGFLAEHPIQLKEAINNFRLITDDDFINFIREAEKRHQIVQFAANPGSLTALGWEITEIKSKKDVYDIMSMYWTSETMDKLWERGSASMPDMAFGFYTEGGSWIFSTDRPEEITVKRQGSHDVTITVKWYIEYIEGGGGYLLSHYILKKAYYGWKVVKLTIKTPPEITDSR